MNIEAGESISTLDLDYVYVHRLNRNGISTISQLTAMSEKDLSSLRTVGDKCVQACKAALATRGLSLAQSREKPEAACLCEDDQEMELIADNPRGSYFECQACGRILYRSKVTPVVAWFRADITAGVPGLQIERRFCADCNGQELHVRASGGDWRCLACVLKYLKANSQKTPEGA